MPESFKVVGAEQFAEVGARLKTAGPALRRDLSVGIARSLHSLESSIRESLRGAGHGGLGEELGNTTSVRVLLHGGGDAGAQAVVIRGGRPVGSVDEGEASHPTFGHEPYVRQSIKAQLVSRPMEEQEPEVTRAVSEAMDATSKRVTR